MGFSGNHTFDAPIDRVWAMFRDRDAHVAKFAGMGHRDIEVLDFSSDDDHAHLVIQRVVDVELPGFAKKVLKPTNTVVSTDDWETDGAGGYHGTFSVDAKGAPIVSKGTTKLTASGERTDYVITVDLKVNVPLIGGKIADWAKGDILAQIRKEFAAGDAWLAEH